MNSGGDLNQTTFDRLPTELQNELFVAALSGASDDLLWRLGEALGTQVVYCVYADCEFTGDIFATQALADEFLAAFGKGWPKSKYTAEGVLVQAKLDSDA